MRCFVAIDLPEKIRNHLYTLQTGLRDSPAKINWVQKDLLHLTLKFLGEIEESKAKEIMEKLKVIKFKSFLTSIAELGVFPSEKYIRIIWVGLKPFEKIEELHEKIDSELANLGFARDSRFQTHITLGRVKFVNDKQNFLSRLRVLKLTDITEPFTIDNFKLKKSTLTPKGPIYEDVAILTAEK